MSRQKQRTVTLNRKQLDKLEADSILKGIELTQIYYLTALKNEFGFGQKRLMKVMDTVCRYLEFERQGLISIKDGAKELEKLGVNIRVKDRRLV